MTTINKFVNIILILHFYEYHRENTNNSFIVNFFLGKIKCDYLVGILDVRVMKGQNGCLLCWKTWHYTTIFYLSLIFSFKFKWVQFWHYYAVVVWSWWIWFTMWLINNVHVVVEGPKTWIWPLLSLKLFISFVFPFKVGFFLFMLVI